MTVGRPAHVPGAPFDTVSLDTVPLDTVPLDTVPLDTAGRLPRLVERFDEIDVLVVTRPPNIRYLTGFTGSAGTLVVDADGGSLLCTDGRYAEQSRRQVEDAGVATQIEIAVTVAETHAAVANFLSGRRRIGLEAHGLTWAAQRGYAEAFGPDRDLVATEGLVEALRRRKDAGEIARIAAACAIADEAFGVVRERLGDGLTEREVALDLELEMRRRGASAVSFDPIVASGPNGAMPHARPTDRTVRHGELVVCDFGCIVDGYCSDMTRTVSVGPPDERSRDLYTLVASAQAAGAAAVAPGVDLIAVDAAARAPIVDAGYGEQFSHGTGHGVGIEVHESPRVARTSSGTLQVGDVVTVEPGVYLPGVGGVRVEDTLAVTEEGADTLTNSPKELIL